MSKRTHLHEQSEKGSVILFEDNKVIVVKILTQEAACYYAQDSPWCKHNRFSNYNRVGDVYYLISKTPKSYYKSALFVDTENMISTSYKLNDGDEISIRVLLLQFPSAKDVIGELYPFNITSNLEDYITGTIDGETLMSLNPSIYDIFKKEQIRGSHELLIINEDTNNLLENLLDLHDMDVLAFSFAMGSFEWNTYDSVYESIMNWGGLSEISDDKTVLILKDISDYLLPDKKFNFEDNYFLGRLLEKINKKFPGELDVVFDKYHYKLNHLSREEVRKISEKELNDFLETLGFENYSDYNELTTTVGNLLYWCRRNDYVGTLDNLIRLIFEHKSREKFNWSNIADSFTIGENPEEKNKIIQSLNDTLNNILSKIKNNS